MKPVYLRVLAILGMCAIAATTLIMSGRFSALKGTVAGGAYENIASGEQCEQNALPTASESNSEKVYFVGCGGFF